MRVKDRLSPSVYLLGSFLFLIVFGALILTGLPTVHDTHISFIDALFMSTSATCVTGLSVVDIGKDFTPFAQMTILALIQLGGIGIMTFSTVLLLALGRNISFRSRFVIQDIFAHSPQADLHVLLGRVLLFTFSFEIVGAMLLFIRFCDRFSPETACYYAMFHSIIAFCNAGFSLFSDSFVGYSGDLLVNLTVIVLIIFGGIGFMVLHELARAQEKKRIRSRTWNQLSLHTKIVLFMTLTLLVGGTLFFLASEWSNTLKEMSLGRKLLASFFQSVTPRTAGFNTLDYSAMNNITLLGTIMLMFIGASPGSTGGGIKTTTLGVFVVLTRARLTGSEHVHAFKRSISQGSMNRAFSIFVLSVIIIIIGTAGLLISQLGTVPHGATRGEFLELLFETTSAFGTVGLSMGVTGDLNAWSKFILVLIMFTGRLGPLVVAMAVQPREKSKGRFRYAEERVMIG